MTECAVQSKVSVWSKESLRHLLSASAIWEGPMSVLSRKMTGPMNVTAVCIDAMPAFSNNNVQVALPATVVVLWASQGFSCCGSNNNAGARKKRKAQRIRVTTKQASIFGAQHLQKQLVHWVGINAGPIWASSCSSNKQLIAERREWVLQLQCL